MFILVKNGSRGIENGPIVDIYIERFRRTIQEYKYGEYGECKVIGPF